MSVPFLDLQAGYRELQSEFDAAYQRVMASGRYLQGGETEQFEQEYAAYCEAAHCVTVANGLDALRLALLALDIGAGDEVIVPSHTFIATWLAVSQTGAVPVPVEPDLMTYNIDPERLGTALTPRTRAIIPVHLYGQPAELDPILAFARRHNLLVVEDAAQAQGARYRGRRIGGIGDVTAWSFYPGKNLGAFGDAGAVTTNNADIARRIRRLGNYGSFQRYVHDEPGWNSRVDELQAAFLRVKLRRLDAWNQRRRTLAHRYLTEIRSTDLVLPQVRTWCEPVWHLFVVRHPQRDVLQKRLVDAGIATQVHYPLAIHAQQAFKPSRYGPLRLAEQLAAEVLSFPLGPQMSAEQVDRVISALNETSQ